MSLQRRFPVRQSGGDDAAKGCACALPVATDGRVQRFRGLAAVSRHFAPLYAKAADLPEGSPLKAEARRISSAACSPARPGGRRAQARPAGRPLYLRRPRNGNLTPAAAAETWKRRYGDCKGKTALLLGLLAELGIEAEATSSSTIRATTTASTNDCRIPDCSIMFSSARALTAKSIGWTRTLPPVAAPASDPVIDYRWSCRSARRAAIWKSASGARPNARTKSACTRSMRAPVSISPQRVTNTTITRGIAGLQQQAQLSGLSADQLLTGLRRQIVGNTWQTVDEVKLHYDQKAAASVLTVVGSWEVDWGKGCRRAVAGLAGRRFQPARKAASAAGPESGSALLQQARIFLQRDNGPDAVGHKGRKLDLQIGL